MGRKARPVDVILLDGKKHLTKAEIEERRAAEARVKPPSDKVYCPRWLDAEGRKEWHRVYSELKALDLLTNVDVSSLACYCDLVSQYIAASLDIHERGMILRSSLTGKGPDGEPEKGSASIQMSKALKDLMFPNEGKGDDEDLDRKGVSQKKLTLTLEEPNPSVAQAAKCAQLIKSYLVEFGLSPSARVKLRPPKKEESEETPAQRMWGRV